MKAWGLSNENQSMHQMKKDVTELGSTIVIQIPTAWTSYGSLKHTTISKSTVYTVMPFTS